ncbi:MAG: hypothetical protein LBF12_07275 [Christensenellaceae bacterium]|jgi:signal peptidase I|nr:hypothetical protein [Christensenellaceae bacterium]
MEENKLKKTIKKITGVFSRKGSDKGSDDAKTSTSVDVNSDSTAKTASDSPEKTTKKKVLKIVNICTNIILGFVLIIVLLFAVMAISKQQLEYNKLFGYTFLSVASDSMVGTNEDSFDKGDLIIGRVIEGNEEELDKLKVGDVITFFTLLDDASGGKSKQPNTHRIMEINPGSREGERNFITKGDNAPFQDYGSVDESAIIAVYTGKVKGMGAIVSTLQDSEGFLYFILIPSAIAVIYCLYLFIANLIGFMKVRTEMQFAEKAKLNSTDIDPSEKERIKQELLKEMGIDPTLLNKAIQNDNKVEGIDETRSSSSNDDLQSKNTTTESTKDSQ